MTLTKKEIRKLFEKIRDKSYKIYCKNVKLYFGVGWIMKKMGVLGYSSPFNGNVYLNYELIRKIKPTKKEIIGAIAHELAHQEQYRIRTFVKKWILLWNYYFSVRKRRKTETEADKITLRKGYGRELLKGRGKLYKQKPQAKKAYLSPMEIRKLMGKNKLTLFIVMFLMINYFPWKRW